MYEFVTIGAIALAIAGYVLRGKWRHLAAGLSALLPDALATHLIEDKQAPVVRINRHGTVAVTLTYEQPAVQCLIPPWAQQRGFLRVHGPGRGDRITTLAYYARAAFWKAGEKQEVAGWVAIDHRTWTRGSTDRWVFLNTELAGVAYRNAKNVVRGKEVLLDDVPARYIFYAPALAPDQVVSLAIEYQPVADGL